MPMTMGGRTVPCKWCKEPTTFLGTRECNGCHYLRVYASEVKQRCPDAFLKILQHLAGMEVEGVPI